MIGNHLHIAKRIASFVCFILLSVFITWSEELVFVQPRVIDSELPATPNNIQKTQFRGETVLSFEILPTDGSLIELENMLIRSKMISKVFKLRRQARSLLKSSQCSDICVDNSTDPFIVYVGDAMGLGGPAVASNVRILADDYDRKIRSNSLLILAPLKIKNSVMTIPDFQKQNYLAPLISHEFFHGLMGDLYGDRMMEIKARSYSRNGHAADRVTDEFIAFVEGTAEALELVAMEQFSDEVSHKLIDYPELTDNVRGFIRRFKRNRLVLARHNKLSFIADGQVLDGELDSANDILKTEGVIATLTYRIFFANGLDVLFDKLLQTLAKHRPLHFLDLIEAFIDDYPEYRAKVLRQFLEITRYVTVDQQAADLYKDYYLAKKAWKQKKVSEEIKQAKADRWSFFREQLYEGVLNKSISIDENVRKPYVVADENFFYNLDLNLANRFDLEDFFEEFFSENYSKEQQVSLLDVLFKMRQDGDYIESMDSIVWPDDVELLLDSMHARHLASVERRVTEKLKSLLQGIYRFDDAAEFEASNDSFISHTNSVFHLQNSDFR